MIKHDSMGKVIFGCAALMILAIVLFIAGAIFLGGCLVKKIHDTGIKPTIERVWEGPEKNSE